LEARHNPPVSSQYDYVSGRADLTDGELLRRARQGEDAAFSRLYVAYEALIAGFLMRRARDAQLAADLTAETFAAAILGADRFRDEGQSALPWLLGIAGHLLSRAQERGRAEHRALGRLGIEQLAVGEASLERVEALAEAEDPSNPFLQALERLPESQRDAVRAYVIDEQPYPELARQLGVTEATVRQRVSRGLARLRTTLAGRTP
jgi:RNA polymerase sigma factor (sigma-70 family)